jgi:hypothetical protein
MLNEVKGIDLPFASLARKVIAQMSKDKQKKGW